MAAMHPVDYYSTFTKNCSDFFTEEEVKHIRAFYYAMCAEADAMLGKSTAVKSGEGDGSRLAGSSKLILRHRKTIQIKIKLGVKDNE